MESSGKAGRAAAAWQGGSRGGAVSSFCSASRALRAVTALWQWPHKPSNLVGNSSYTVYTLVQTRFSLRDPLTLLYSSLFLTLQALLDRREHTLFITHMCSHAGLPGPMSDSSARADTLVSIVGPFQKAVTFH